jgi:serine/threonine protein kinase
MKMDTKTGGTGTIDYCSPERLTGELNSSKEDLWALGVTIY